MPNNSRGLRWHTQHSVQANGRAGQGAICKIHRLGVAHAMVTGKPNEGDATMKKSTLISLGISVSIAVLAAGAAISAQDKYTLQVPNGLAFSEFRGYEDWPVIAISENEGLIAVIVGNPAMIDAYKEGVPGNGKPFPDGAKMAKIHWTPKKQEATPVSHPCQVRSMTLISW